MELRDIEYFAVVAEHGHLGRAAEALGLSQPALSKSLRRLEKAMQAKLVTRTSKGVDLTPEGSALLAHVHPLRLSLHDIAREIAELGAGRVGYLRFGSNPGSADYLLPGALGALRREAPRVTVSLTIGGDIVLLPGLRNGELDLCLMSIPPVPYEGIQQERLYRDEFVVYAASRHRLSQMKRVEIADLAGEGWAFPVLNGNICKWLHRVFEDAGLAPPRITLLGGPMQIRLQSIAASDLLGMAPRRIVRQLAPHLRLAEIPVKGLVWKREVGVGYRKDAYLAPITRRFIGILKAAARDFTGESS